MESSFVTQLCRVVQFMLPGVLALLVPRKKLGGETLSRQC